MVHLHLADVGGIVEAHIQDEPLADVGVGQIGVVHSGAMHHLHHHELVDVTLPGRHHQVAGLDVKREVSHVQRAGDVQYDAVHPRHQAQVVHTDPRLAAGGEVKVSALLAVHDANVRQPDVSGGQKDLGDIAVLCC